MMYSRRKGYKCTDCTDTRGECSFCGGTGQVYDSGLYGDEGGRGGLDDCYHCDGIGLCPEYMDSNGLEWDRFIGIYPGDDFVGQKR